MTDRSVTKRSIMLAGRKTSVSLEDAFWNGLNEIAQLQRVTVSNLVNEIEATRKQKNLSSAIRVFVFDHFRQRVDVSPHRATVSNDESQSTRA